MSLKAKLEAVIYASEEPVTLAQLASLFAADAFEWKAEQEAAQAAARAEAGEAEASPEQMVAFVTDAQEEAVAEESATNEQAPEVSDSTTENSEPSTVSNPEQDAKKEARQRDREVRAILRGLIDEIIASYDHDDCGLEVREIAGGFSMGTKPSYHDAVRLFIRSLKPAMKLSLPALETLAVVAYKQPVTAPEVTEIRGVESGGVLGNLLARKLIATAGRKQVIGRPILYKTTKEFLLRFGLKDVSELPSMEEFEKMAAIELDDSGAEEEQTVAALPESNTETGEAADEEANGSGEVTAIEAANTEEATASETVSSAKTGTVADDNSGNTSTEDTVTATAEQSADAVANE